MSEEYYYDRSVNLSGVPNYGGLHLPDYLLGPLPASFGSKMIFRSENFKYGLRDNFYSLIPSSIDSLKATFQLKFEEPSVSDLRLYGKVIEDAAGTGILSFYQEGFVYQPVSGYATNYRLNNIGGHSYDLEVDLEIDTMPNQLNWSGSNFVDHTFNNWNIGLDYEVDDVVYFPLNQDLTKNFYYCTSGHNSSVFNSPLDVESGPWTQKFHWTPDYTYNVNNKIKVDNRAFKNSFGIRQKTEINTIAADNVYSYTNIGDKQTKAMLHFLENKGGYKYFKFHENIYYTQPKTYYSPEWTHTPVFFDNNSLEITMVEQSLGIA